MLNRLGSYVLLKSLELQASLITPEVLLQGFAHSDQQLRRQTGLTPTELYLLALVEGKGSLSDETVTLEDLEKVGVKEFREIMPIFESLVQKDLLRRLPAERAVEYAPTPLIITNRTQ